MDLQAVIAKLGEAFEQFKTANGAEKEKMWKQIEDLETIVARGNVPGGGTYTGSLNTAAAGEYDKAFMAWARKGVGEDALATLSPRAELSTLSDPDGGFVVPERLDKDIDRLAVDSVAMRRLATVKSGLRGDYKRPFSKGGATGGWVGEKDSRAETDSPELALFNPPWSELYALPKVTQTLLDNSDFDVAGWLLDELLATEVEMEGAAFILGNGVKQPKGVLDYDTIANASWAWGKIGYIASGEAAAFTNVDKLIDLQHALKPVYRRNATWLMNDSTWAHIRKFRDGEGQLVWRPGLEPGAPDVLLGKPVEIDDNMPDIAADALPIAFGDFKRGYMIGDHAVGRRLLRDPYTEKPYVKFYQTKRTFGGVINFEAIKLLKVAAS